MLKVHNEVRPSIEEGMGLWYHVVNIALQYEEEEKNYENLTAGGPKEFGSFVNLIRKSAQDMVLLKVLSVMAHNSSNISH